MNKKTNKTALSFTNTTNDNVSDNVSIIGTSGWPLEIASIELPDAWLSVWSKLGVWLLTDRLFGAAKFAADCDRPLIKDIAALAKRNSHDPQLWLAVATRARIAINSALASNLDDECIAAVATAYAFAMATRTGDKHWAIRTCAAAAAARAYGWSAYGRVFSADLIYKQSHADALVAQEVKFSRLLDTCNGIERWAA